MHKSIQLARQGLFVLGWIVTSALALVAFVVVLGAIAVLALPRLLRRESEPQHAIAGR